MALLEARESMLENQDIINKDMFTQLFDLDGEDDSEFLKSIVDEYFEQAKTTFKDMDAMLDKDDLDSLSRLAHTLKGSSGQLGVRKVQDSCEQMQHYGKLREVDGKTSLSRPDAESRIKASLKSAKEAQVEAEKWLTRFFDGSLEDDKDEKDKPPPSSPVSSSKPQSPALSPQSPPRAKN